MEMQTDIGWALKTAQEHTTDNTLEDDEEVEKLWEYLTTRLVTAKTKKDEELIREIWIKMIKNANAYERLVEKKRQDRLRIFSKLDKFFKDSQIFLRWRRKGELVKQELPILERFEAFDAKNFMASLLPLDHLIAVANNNKEAQYYLSKYYEADLEQGQSVVMLKKAAQMGHLGARCNFGVKLLHEHAGSNSPLKNINDAFKLFYNAAKRGLKEAQFNLGVMYENVKYLREVIGRGGIIDPDTGDVMKQSKPYTALRWFIRAAKNGLNKAMDHIESMELKYTLTGEEEGGVLRFIPKYPEHSEPDLKKLFFMTYNSPPIIVKK
jgi:TPR repeat protein